MNNIKILVVTTLLVLTESAWGIGNPDYAVTSPYYDISTKNPKILKENTSRTGQILDFNEVDFFSVVNPAPKSKTPFPVADVELQFSCPQSDDQSHGWYIGLWKHNSTNPDAQLKGYDVSAAHCTNKKFAITIDQNEDINDVIASYYISIQSGCSRFPDLTRFYDTNAISAPIPCDRSDYQLKLGLIPKEIIIDANTLTESELQNATPLGSVKSGKINTATDNNIYSVESNGTAEIPLLFSCTQLAARQKNDWMLTVYDEKNTLVTGYPKLINGNDCGSGLVDDKGGFKFTLPKDSPRYFLSVKSACDSQSKTNCTVDNSEYNIARDVTKIYTGSLSAAKSVTTTNANFKLTRCGLNSSSTIAVKAENIDLSKALKTKTPIKIQIGSTVCQILTPDLATPADIILGNITGNAEIIDAHLIAKDSATVTLGECGSTNTKITLTGAKLDLEDFNPAVVAATTTTATTAVTPISDSVVIPVKVDIGDFHCEGKEMFYIYNDKPTIGDKTYSNNSPTDGIVTPYTNIGNETFSTIGLGNRLETVDKVDYYKLANSPTQNTSLDFACTQSKAIGGDKGWTVTVWEQNAGNPDWLEAVYPVMPTDCDNNGAFKMSVPPSQNSQYIGVQSSCLLAPDDSKSELSLDATNVCKVNTGAYTLSISPIITPPKLDPDAFDTTWLTTKKNLGASQTAQLSSLADVQVYQVDTGTTDANLTFSCPNSVRYQNDWKMLIYDNAKTLKSTTMINGSDCGTGKSGDKGAYPITLTKNSPAYYVVIKSACSSDDTTCAIDSSKYEIKRAAATSVITTPVKVKPFFTSTTAK